MINMNMNIKMHNMNQIYMQISQLMAQAMININQIMTNMNQLMTNMNQMNQLINSVNDIKPNNELNNINFMMNNMNNLFEPKYNTSVIFQQDITCKRFTVNCNTKDKLKDVIQQYRIKSGDTESDRFIKNNQLLNIEKTIEENGIEINYGGVIQCINSSALRGGNYNKKNNTQI